MTQLIKFPLRACAGALYDADGRQVAACLGVGLGEYAIDCQKVASQIAQATSNADQWERFFARASQANRCCTLENQRLRRDLAGLLGLVEHALTRCGDASRELATAAALAKQVVTEGDEGDSPRTEPEEVTP